jgi:hypothetical protein
MVLEYLPTFALRIIQMLVNIPYMEHLGHELGVSRGSAQTPTYTDCGFGSASQSPKTELILQLYVNQELRSSLIPSDPTNQQGID